MNFHHRNWNSCRTEGIRSVISIPNRNSPVQTSLIVMFNSATIMEIVPFSKIILTKEIITRLSYVALTTGGLDAVCVTE